MSSSPTLGSKLRVLIAKSFKAEKLYAAMSGNGIDQRSSVRVELANEVRAREWERSYHQLRLALNKLVSEVPASNAVSELNKIKHGFLRRSEQSLMDIESGRAAMQDALDREEFAFVYKASLEMIKHKARAQACGVAAQEIDVLLEQRGKGGEEIDSIEPYDLDDLDEPFEMPEAAPRASAKVVPITRRFAAGRRSR